LLYTGVHWPDVGGWHDIITGVHWPDVGGWHDIITGVHWPDVGGWHDIITGVHWSDVSGWHDIITGPICAPRGPHIFSSNIKIICIWLSQGGVLMYLEIVLRDI
jgi:hypothetical protein